MLGIKIPKKPNLLELDLKDKIKLLKIYHSTLQRTEQYYKMRLNENISECVNSLKNIYKSKNKPIELEKQVTLALMALNDANQIRPNYPVGDDGEPTFTAPAGVSDIECFYNSFNLICEVTMLTDRTQWYNEGQPVMRHLREFEVKNTEKKHIVYSYLLKFISILSIHFGMQ